MKIALLQLNPIIGDLRGNATKIADATRKAAAQGADLAVSPELGLLGYPPRDLLLNRGFIDHSWAVLAELASDLRESIPLLVGIAEPNDTPIGRPLFNSAVLLRNGKTGARFHKTLLPTYDVFDEDRYFEPAEGPQVLEIDGMRLGISICEDLWNDRDYWQHRRYHTDPVAEVAGERVDALVNMSASPFSLGKQAIREAMMAALARKHGMPLLYTNQVGGNDDLVFDGSSLAFAADGGLIGRGKPFAEDLVLVDLTAGTGSIAPALAAPEAQVWAALVCGTRDYARKCGFGQALLGLSGGIDSALTAAVAVEALGADNVLGVLMPSPFSSQGSIDDSLALAGSLGMPTETLPIEPIMQSFDATLAGVFAGTAPGVTEENIQARIRGNLLMSISNKYGRLLLTTGNKSELAVGYCTLYGDMSGGFAVISDVPKTMVYRISRWLNEMRGREIIPEAILTKAPSAELRPDQTDQDSLPPYAELDAILALHIEQHQSEAEIVARGFDQATVAQVLRLVRIAEFKRRQAAPGVKVTDRAFGSGWRMPIAKRLS